LPDTYATANLGRVLLQALKTFLHWVILRYPIGVEVCCDVQDSQFREARVSQRFVSGTNVGTLIEGTATTVENYLAVTRKLSGELVESGEAVRF
jgi:hypothetical protein